MNQPCQIYLNFTFMIVQNYPPYWIFQWKIFKIEVSNSVEIKMFNNNSIKVNDCHFRLKFRTANIITIYLDWLINFHNDKLKQIYFCKSVTGKKSWLCFQYFKNISLSSKRFNEIQLTMPICRITLSIVCLQFSMLTHGI